MLGNAYDLPAILQWYVVLLMSTKKLLSGEFYNSQLCTAESLDASVGQTTTIVSQLQNRRVLLNTGSLIFPDMSEAKGQRDSRQRSCINTDLAAVVSALVSDLLDDAPLISQVIEQIYSDEITISQRISLSKVKALRSPTSAADIERISSV